MSLLETEGDNWICGSLEPGLKGNGPISPNSVQPAAHYPPNNASLPWWAILRWAILTFTTSSVAMSISPVVSCQRVECCWDNPASCPLFALYVSPCPSLQDIQASVLSHLAITPRSKWINYFAACPFSKLNSSHDLFLIWTFQMIIFLFLTKECHREDDS